MIDLSKPARMRADWATIETSRFRQSERARLFVEQHGDKVTVLLTPPRCRLLSDRLSDIADCLGKPSQKRRKYLEEARDAMCPDGCAQGTPVKYGKHPFAIGVVVCAAMPIRALLAEMNEAANA